MRGDVRRIIRRGNLIYAHDRSVFLKKQSPNKVVNVGLEYAVAADAMMTDTTAPAVPSAAAGDRRTARILARSIYKDMKSYGVGQDRILEVASELIGLVTADLNEDAPSAQS